MESQDAAALPTRELKLNGQTLRLKMGYACLVALQRHWKLNSHRDVQAYIAEHQDDLAILAEIVWGLTRSHHKDLTIAQIEDLIDSAPSMEEIGEAMREAMEAAAPPASKPAGAAG